MLARRFAFVCLITALFGMGLARLVAQASNEPMRWTPGVVHSSVTPEAYARTQIVNAALLLTAIDRVGRQPH